MRQATPTEREMFGPDEKVRDMARSAWTQSTETHPFARFATRQAVTAGLPIYWWHTAVLSEVGYAFDAGKSECPENLAYTLGMSSLDVRAYLSTLRGWGLIADGEPNSDFATEWVSLPCACGACETHDVALTA